MGQLHNKCTLSLRDTYYDECKVMQYLSLEVEETLANTVLSQFLRKLSAVPPRQPICLMSHGGIQVTASVLSFRVVSVAKSVPKKLRDEFSFANNGQNYAHVKKVF